jgi:hypothetical protein
MQLYLDLTLWQRLIRFLDYPVLELSNNLAENAIRPVALGRRNWIHIGSKEAGPRVAAIISVVETCRRLKIAVPRLPELSAARVGRFSSRPNRRANARDMGDPKPTNQIQRARQPCVC